jgi:hypothetical protein
MNGAAHADDEAEVEGESESEAEFQIGGDGAAWACSRLIQVTSSGNSSVDRSGFAPTSCDEPRCVCVCVSGRQRTI